MGLHNKFPRHFYKRGNLFNTYLGHSDFAEAPDEKRAPAEGQRETPRAGGAGNEGSRYSVPFARPFRPNAPAKKLVAFARRHMTSDEARRLLRLISDANGLPPRAPGPDVWSQLAYALSVGLPQERVEGYLAVLESRRRAGQPLIQSKENTP
jgi:hypothetical protein